MWTRARDNPIIPLTIPCEMCNGSGIYYEDEYDRILCKFCEGKGRVINPDAWLFRRQNK